MQRGKIFSFKYSQPIISSLWKSRGWNFLFSIFPLFKIHQIMRMPLLSILNFLIVIVVIFSLVHLIMILIFPLLIFLSHQPLMIYLMMTWNFRKLLRHFNPRWWLCQVLAFLRSIPIPIRIMMCLSRLLITLPDTLKINLSHNFCILHLHCTILYLSSWRSHTWWAQLKNESFILYLCSPVPVVWKFGVGYLQATMCRNTIMHPRLSSMWISFILFYMPFQTSNTFVCIILYFLLIVMLEYLSWHEFPHLHRPANAPMATMEVSFHVGLPYSLIRVGVGIVFCFSLLFWIVLFAFI